MDPVLEVVTIVFVTISVIVVLASLAFLCSCDYQRSISPPQHAYVEEPSKVAYVVSEQPSASAPCAVESSEDPV
jgi:hypothetical protein